MLLTVLLLAAAVAGAGGDCPASGPGCANGRPAVGTARPARRAVAAGARDRRCEEQHGQQHRKGRRLAMAKKSSAMSTSAPLLVVRLETRSGKSVAESLANVRYWYS